MEIIIKPALTHAKNSYLLLGPLRSFMPTWFLLVPPGCPWLPYVFPGSSYFSLLPLGPHGCPWLALAPPRSSYFPRNGLEGPGIRECHEEPEGTRRSFLSPRYSYIVFGACGFHQRERRVGELLVWIENPSRSRYPLRKPHALLTPQNPRGPGIDRRSLVMPGGA